jgi:protein ImuB
VFAVVCVPNFALQALLRREPELCKRPVALVEVTGANLSKTFILECTRTAEAAGVCAGLTAPQAQARCRELVLKSRLPAAEQSATEILLQTASTFSPNIEHTAPGVCTIDLRGLNFGSVTGQEARSQNIERSLLAAPAANDISTQQSFSFDQGTATNLPATPLENRSDSLSDWAGRIVVALRQLGFEAQVGIGCTPNIALLAARAAETVLLVERVKEFFDSLPIAALEPTPPVLDILRRWGIHTAGAFLSLGKDAIARRLGREALELFQHAGTKMIRPLKIVLPADMFEEQIEFEALIETIEPLLFVLRRFVEQLAMRIALSYRVIAEFELTLGLESGVSYQRTFKIPAPTANVETLFRMLHTHLENLRTEAPIKSLRLSAIPCRSQSQQFSLFESALRDPNHFHETLARLTALLGTERVGTPIAHDSHHPDVFRMQMPDFTHAPSANTQLKTRNTCSLCLRRFRPPILADVELKDGRPVFINSLKINGKVVKTPRGPWYTSGNWWDQRRWVRQEWDVEIKDGTVYRLFHAKSNWHIEGVYD